MFSATASLRRSAAWRISLLATLVFACGTLLVFLYLHHYVANDIQRRTDAWLTGELYTLRDVAIRTPKDALYNRVLRETAEMASHEIPSRSSVLRKPGEPNQAVFFLQTGSDGSPILWVGAADPSIVSQSLQKNHLTADTPVHLTFPGTLAPFRVAVASMPDGTHIYLGVSEQDEMRTLRRLRTRFFFLWLLNVFLGFGIIFWITRRTLGAVRKITDAVSRIGDEDLSQRIPENGGRDEMAQLASTLNRMLQRIESSMYQLHTITNALAHDLRSPLTAIRARLEIALSNGDGPPHTESVVRAIEEIDRLSEMLNQSLDVAEAQAGALRLHPRPIDLEDLLTTMGELYRPSMNEKGLRLDLRVLAPARIYGDPALLHRAIANLFDNELKHLPASRTITLSLNADQISASLLIEDDGPGFPPEIVSDVFKPRVKGRASGGLGLGLAFVEAVVLAHNGTVTAVNRQPSGGRISIYIPLYRAMDDPFVPQSQALAGKVETAGPG
jgi:signal transduction histidine kinase